MDLITVSLPTPEEEERARRFQVHYFYILGICIFIMNYYKCNEDNYAERILTEQNDLDSVKKINRKKDIQCDYLKQYLFISWASEIQLRLGSLIKPALLRYSNAWAPVHAYYTVYMAAQSWFVSMGQNNLADNHSSSLSLISSQLENRNLFPSPWSVSCSGCPQTNTECYRNIPPGINPHAKCEVLSRPSYDDFWPRFCTMLKTTRERHLERCFEEWKRQHKRKRMYDHEKQAVAKKVHPTTLFDFFWRLCVRSNYRDVSAFLMSAVPDEWQEEFYQNLLILTEITSLLLQNLTAKYWGRREYEAALNEFLSLQRCKVEDVFGPFEKNKLVIIQG